MSKNRRNGMLGVGGQRSNLSRRALRGGKGAPGNGTDPAAEKKELLRKMRERTRSDSTGPRATEPGTTEPGTGQDGSSEQDS